MEPTQPTNQPPQQTNPSSELSATTPEAPNKKVSNKSLFILLGVLGILIIAVVCVIVFGKSGEQKMAAKEETLVEPTQVFDSVKKAAENSPNALAASNLFVYGSWTGQTSVIKTVDIATSKTQVLASLPMTIKKISVINDRTLLYIDQVDKKDHGKHIALYDIKDKKTVASVSAAEGFGIDEYILSPDKKYMAIWEVSFAKDSDVFYGGKSRVYTVELAKPTVKHLLYDEVATTPVHYPRAILNNGTVFTDKFMPNNGAGWAYGMSIASFDGKNKKDIDTMKAGTYGLQPSLSADGKFLLFAGYNGKSGDGNKVMNGFRQAILTPNTVELLNTETLQKTKLPNLSDNDSYATTTWDTVTGKILLSIVGATPDKTGFYAYDISTGTLEKMDTPKINNTEYMLISGLANNKQLLGAFEEKASNVGNLGEHYEYAYTKVALLDRASMKSQSVALEDTYAQFITVLPADYFNKVLGVKIAANPQPSVVDLYSDENAPKERVQLYTFFVKYDLQEIRENQQSTPSIDLSKISLAPNANKVPSSPGDDNQEKCNDVTARVCAEKGQGPETKDYVACKGAYKAQNMNKTCDDSPLYLYGQPGQKVAVRINTPVYNAIPSYQNGYDVMLGDNGKMIIDGKSYSRIAYDYSSNLKVRKAPKEGAIVAKNQVAEVLKTYAAKLGLNEKETLDLVTAGRQKITSPYAFISFFDHETSQQILPISFSPKPDNYLNVVFYFRLLNVKPIYTPDAPTFPEPLNRSGFTAIEVSEVVE